MADRDHIEHVRPLITLRTPLGRIAQDHPEWLRTVEPRLDRPSDTSCWFWNGSLNGEGEPCIMLLSPADGKRKQTILKRIIASWFWDLKPQWDVVHGCQNLNCLNPRHFYVTNVHWTQHDRAGIIRKMALRIRRWGLDRE